MLTHKVHINILVCTEVALESFLHIIFQGSINIRVRLWPGGESEIGPDCFTGSIHATFTLKDI